MDGGRLGRVQARSSPAWPPSGSATGCGQRVARAQPGPAFVVVEVPHALILPEPTDIRPGCEDGSM